MTRTCGHDYYSQNIKQRSDGYTRPSSNKVNLICTLWCSFLSCFRGWKSLACNENNLGLKCFIGWRRHQTIVDTESHSTTLFLSEFSTNVMCFQLTFEHEHHERNEVLRKSSYNTASYQEL